MLGDISRVSSIYVVTGYTDMRKNIDSLMAIVAHKYSLDPYSTAVFLFCGRRADRIKALHFAGDGFELIYKRLDGTGRFKWPRNESEAKLISRQQFRWLLEGLALEQPTVIRQSSKNKDV